MARKQYRATAKKKIIYTYKCEHCGKMVERVHELMGMSSQSSTPGGLNVEAEKSLDASITKMKEGLEKGVYPFEDKCPYCKKHQTWSIKNNKKLLWEIPLGAFVVALLIFWMFGTNDNGLVWILPIFIVVGFIIAVIMNIQVIVQTRNVQNKQIPHVNMCNTPEDALKAEAIYIATHTKEVKTKTKKK